MGRGEKMGLGMTFGNRRRGSVTPVTEPGE